MSGRTDYLGIGFDTPSPAGVRARMAAVEAGAPLLTVVTPNVDHLVRFHVAGADPALRRRIAAAYDGATLCLCDSRILARLAALDGVSLSVVPGSDLTATIVRELVRPGDRVAVVGGDAGTVAGLGALCPGVEVVQHVPPMGLRHNEAAQAEAALFVEAAAARYSFLAVGAPQQELVALKLIERGRATGAVLCVGASIDFLTGGAKRAPRWMQRAHVEWLHRLLSDPKRMWRRYLVEGPRILAIRRRWKREQR